MLAHTNKQTYNNHHFLQLSAVDFLSLWYFTNRPIQTTTTILMVKGNLAPHLKRNFLCDLPKTTWKACLFAWKACSVLETLENVNHTLTSYFNAWHKHQTLAFLSQTLSQQNIHTYSSHLMTLTSFLLALLPPFETLDQTKSNNFKWLHTLDQKNNICRPFFNTLHFF